ncbi:alpha/beta hydrolase [Malonomonas rubra]|uniref:alpha/beta hydrolase n=1 Tax=Malonomonas rubra TaxID=57040 RepID=UPI0026F1B78C|nr:alpha/beta hydrolase [Malonomonas rubra]
MPANKGLFTTLPFLLNGFLLPIPVCAALEHLFLYFPDREIVMTPTTMRLEFEDVFFTSEDGIKLHGWYLPGEAGKPVVVFCHGNAGNISHRVDILRLLRQLGLTSFIFDYRGYGQSEGKASEKGTYRDMRAAISWLRKKGWQGEQMIYFGRSVGAGVALQLALEQPPAALVLESPFTSIKAMAQHNYPLLWLLAGWALEARYDNLTKIDRLQVPLLILHGDRDRIVPQQMGKQLFERAQQPKTFYSIPGAGHNNTYDVGGTRYWQQWQNLLQQYF